MRNREAQREWQWSWQIGVVWMWATWVEVRLEDYTGATILIVLALVHLGLALVSWWENRRTG